MTSMDDLEVAWDALHDATPPGWVVGCPSYHHERDQWQQYVHDPHERAAVGKRRREWTAVASTEEAGVREMARCLRVISQGRIPR